MDTDQTTPYPPPHDARDAAYRVLSAHAKAFPDLQPIEPDVSQLDPRDRALTHAIIREGIVRWITLRHIVSELAGRGFETIEARMQAVLIGGAAQLLLLDRLPPHAVINESVEWSKHYIRPKAGGMTNAILRKVARSRGDHIEKFEFAPSTIPLSDGGALKLNHVELPSDVIAHKSAAYSIPKATIKRWEKQLPEQSDELLAHSITRPPTLLYSNMWEDIHTADDLAPHDSKNHRVHTGSRAHLIQLLDEHKALRVQDPASSSVVDKIPPGHYNTIIDFCAGQGTKTRQLSDRYPDAKIYAMDVDPYRLQVLSGVFQDHPRVSVHHTNEINQITGQGIDLIMTDVPCSNSGVLARRMEARYRPMTAQVNRIANIQREIVTKVLTALKPGGTLSYSTCSIETEENQDQRDWMINDLNLKLISEHQLLPVGQPGDDPRHYQDATYACFMRK